MKHKNSNFNENSQVEKAAADWIMRIDRGLSPEEQDQYTDWLAEDPRHREAMAFYEWGWNEFDRLAGLQTAPFSRIDPDLLSPDNGFFPKFKSRNNIFTWLSTLPIAAVLAFAVYLALPLADKTSGLEVQPAVELLARIDFLNLEDGSTVKINRGAKVKVAYSDNERRVNLLKGEANFEVAKDANRPFVVNVAGVDVRAVGTVFSVSLTEDKVDVIVTEGIVNVRPSSKAKPDPSQDFNAFLEIGQRARVAFQQGNMAVAVETIDEEEIEEANRWQPHLLDFDNAPLAEIVAEFNRRNPIQVSLADPSLESMRLSSSFWSDNVEGFVRLMESSFGMDAEWQGSREIVIRDAKSTTH